MPIVLASSTCAGWSAGCAAAIRTAPYLMPGRGGTSRNALVLPFFFFFWLYLVPFSLHPTWSDGHWLTVLTLIFPRLHICSADPFIYLFVCDLFPFSLLTVMYRLATTRPLSATVAIFSLAVRVSGWSPQSNKQNASSQMSQHRQTAFHLPCRLRRLWFALPIDTNKKKNKKTITPEMSFRFRYRYTFGEDDCCACIYIYIWNNNNNTREKGRQFDGWLELMHRRLTKLKKKKKTKTIFEYREKALRRHSIFSFFFPCCYCFCAFHSSFVKLFPLKKKKGSDPRY